MQLVQPVGWFSRWAGSAGGLVQPVMMMMIMTTMMTIMMMTTMMTAMMATIVFRVSLVAVADWAEALILRSMLSSGLRKNDARCSWFSPNWHSWISRLAVCPMASSMEEESLLASLGPSPSQ